MRQDDDGRNTVPPWGDAQGASSYAVGDRVYSHNEGGTVHAVGDGTIDVAWDSADKKYGAVTYPSDAHYLRRAYPWES